MNHGAAAMTVQRMVERTDPERLEVEHQVAADEVGRVANPGAQQKPGGFERAARDDHIRAAELVEIAGGGCVQYVEWPKDKKAIDIGDFYADSSKFKGTTGWKPSVFLREGLGRTVAFYRQHFDRYVDRVNRAAERV